MTERGGGKGGSCVDAVAGCECLGQRICERQRALGGANEGSMRRNDEHWQHYKIHCSLPSGDTTK